MNEMASSTTPHEEIKLTPSLALLLIAIGLFFAILFFELIVRFILIPAEKGNRPTADRPIVYFLPEREEEGNAYLKKQPNEFRIAVLGDSFTYGLEMQLDDTFSGRLEKYLNLNLKQRPVRVLNLGKCGFSTAQEVDAYLRRAQEISADLVLIEITLNDPELVPYRVSHSYLDEHGKVKLTSPIYHYWKGLAFVVSRILNAKIAREYKQYYFDLFNTPETWNRMSDALALLKRKTEEKNIPLVGVVFPLFNGAFDNTYPYASLHSKITHYLRSIHVPSLDLLDSYKGMDNSRLQIRPGVDSHPNEIAHRIAAESILGFLHKQHLLPKDTFPTTIKGIRK